MKPVLCYSALKRLIKLKGRDRIKLLELLGPEYCKLLAECTHNILVGNIKLKKKEEKELKKNKNLLLKLVNKKTSIKHQHKILSQKGGALLPIIAAPVLTFLAETILKKIF